MKKLLLSVIIASLLTGCNYTKPEVTEEEEPNYEWVQEWKYELSTKNNAFMYNPSIVKLVAYTGTGDSFTYMVPKFHNYTQMQEDSDYYDGYLKITPLEKTVDKKVKDPHETADINYTFRYLTEDQYFAQKGNWLLNELASRVLDVNSYDTEKYEDYNTYVLEFEKELSDVYKQEVMLEPSVKLVGEEVDHQATGYYLYTESEKGKQYFPCATYYWKIDSGNYLSVHIEIVEEGYKDLIDVEKLVTLKDKELSKQLSKRSESTHELLPYAEDISDYVIIGDYSNLFPEDISDKTSWTNLADDISEVYEEKITVGFEDTTPGGGYDSYETDTIAHFVE